MFSIARIFSNSEIFKGISIAGSYKSTLFITSRRNKHNKMSDQPTRTISYVTIANEASARKLARGISSNRRSLVEFRHAACVNIVSEVKSIYEWQGKIEEEAESMLIIKSDSRKTSQLIEFIELNHPYECPEIVTVKIESGSKKYLDWISESVSKQPIKSTE